jgi:EmrB/QacA subfamily drug resistance transporter
MMTAAQRSAGRQVPVWMPGWAVLAICCVAQFMVVLDVAIVNVALPQMRQDLGLSVTGQQWVVNAYTLTFAGLLMLGGRAGDLFGRRRVFMIGLALFTFCSLMGGLAQNGPWLIAARAAQGVGGAILAPSTLSLLTVKFFEPTERRRALGAWSATAASGAAIGVLVGGILTDLLDWRWVLFVNVPIGILLLVGAWLALTESRLEGAHQSLDLPGALTMTAGLSILVYGIVSTDTHPWGSAQTLTTLAAGGILLLSFLFIESRAEHPIVPLSIFKMKTLSAANGIAVTVGAALFGMYFFLSLFLQQVNGYSPLKAGLAFLPAGLATMGGALTAPRLMTRIGPRRQLVTGLLLAAIGLAWMSTVSAHGGYLAHVLGPVLLVGVGLGLSFVPMTMAATTGVPAHEAGLASGLVNTSRQVGGAVGLAVMATVASSAARGHAATVSAASAALTNGYDEAFAIAAAALVVGAGLALLLPGMVRTARQPQEAYDRDPATDGDIGIIAAAEA